MNSFLLIKPDAYNRGLSDNVRKDILSECKKMNLSIVTEKTKNLTVEEVLRIYPTIFEKSFSYEFIKLMTSNSSTLILVSGEDNVLEKTKAIRGYHRFREDEEIRGIRGKYSYVENVSLEEVKKMKAGGHPKAEQFIAVIIEGIVHAPDAQDEIPVILDIFSG